MKASRVKRGRLEGLQLDLGTMFRLRHGNFLVNGSAPDVLDAYKIALEHKGWAVTVVSSEGWGGAGNRPQCVRMAVKALEPQPRRGNRR
jgi:hypothetical protein